MAFVMMLKNYLKYSGIWFGLVVNPYHWEFRFEFLHPDDLNPNMRGCFITVGPVWSRIVIDDGTW